MSNKHFCQGPFCHTKLTQDRFLKSKGIIRGRYALNTIDSDSDWCKRAKYLCSTRCEMDWLDENMLAVEMRIPVPFITHRRISEGYEKATENTPYHSYPYIRKIPVDNDNENDRIIP